MSVASRSARTNSSAVDASSPRVELAQQNSHYDGDGANAGQHLLVPRREQTTSGKDLTN